MTKAELISRIAELEQQIPQPKVPVPAAQRGQAIGHNINVAGRKAGAAVKNGSLATTSFLKGFWQGLTE